jgi:AraC family transcriptional regulator of adaptative response/methylated-DNA-[protein]-cysteine methyltransferase
MLSFEEKYEALLKKDSTFEGVFITAVKTTGIFCRPTCTARKPKPENVIFYETANEAILNGFRPCKVCRPLELADETPAYVRDLLQELHQNPFIKIDDEELRKRGRDPHQIRRWFKKHHRLTFQAYQRMLRINSAYQKIARGESVTGAAFESGYESLSGFQDGFQSYFGNAPTRSMEKTVIHIVRFTTPLGPMFGCATDLGVCLAEFTDRKMLETEFKQLEKRLNGVVLPGQHPHLDLLQTQLSEYFDGNRRQFTVPLHTPGTPFQQLVWQDLHEIPYGETRSYKQQAQALHLPKSVRPVASANGHNRVCILIPCHRVIGEDGNLTGYGGGLARKKWLLDLEKKYIGSPVQGMLTFEEK